MLGTISMGMRAVKFAPQNSPVHSWNASEHLYQKGKTNVDFTEARDSEWQWHQLGHMQVCTSLQTDNHASTPPLCSFTGRMPFLPPNQQHQSTKGLKTKMYNYCKMLAVAQYSTHFYSTVRS